MAATYQSDNLITTCPRPLRELAEREAMLHDVCLAGRPRRVGLNWEERLITIETPGWQIAGRLERPLLHQLGSRLELADPGQLLEQAKFWRRESDWWSAHLTAEGVEEVLGRDDVILRLLPDGETAHLYGLISPGFRKTGKLHFRHHFQQGLRRRIGQSFQWNGCWADRWGMVWENYQLDRGIFGPRPIFGLDIKLGYGLDNGYSAFRINLSRSVLACLNGMSSWTHPEESEWRHNSPIQIEAFADQVLNSVIKHNEWLLERWQSAQGTPLESESLWALMRRIDAPVATQERIAGRLESEINAVGRNQWALSQALTWLGTHERAIPRGWRYTGLGTQILERGLEAVLEDHHSGSDSRLDLILDHDLADEILRQRPRASDWESRIRGLSTLN